MKAKDVEDQEWRMRGRYSPEQNPIHTATFILDRKRDDENSKY